MKRTTRIIGSSTGMLAIAAFAGLITGTSSHASAAPAGIHSTTAHVSMDGKAGAKARTLDDQAGKHDCKGKNDCKGNGGCKSSDNGCKGKNSCKGKGGCKTNGDAL